MNLKHHLLIKITIVAIFCFLTTTAYVLYRADQQSKQQSQIMLESISKQLNIQLLHIDSGLSRRDQFPDFSLWKETHSNSGVCIQYRSENKAFTRNICRGSEWSEKQWPKLFETIYRLIFTPGLEVFSQITYKNQPYGYISIIPSVEMELQQAWDSVRALLELSSMTIFTVCLLVYLSINRALLPAQTIVSGLEKMQKGDLTVRIPNFELLEWQSTSSAINKLAISQQKSISERKRLSLKLINLQDEERRYLARELHDELGQCLAAINALSESITQTAEQECHEIVEDAKSLSRINGHIMQTIRNLLVKLRPTEIDELGLELSLKALVNEWNSHSNNKIHYQLRINGDCQQLTAPYPITLFRIIQESLTNIYKHSRATHATVEIDINNELIMLTINDDGKINLVSFVENSGFGLLGIRERVYSLDGQLQFNKNVSGGLNIKVTLPVSFEGDIT
ncbi:MAG: sensor histidine kinase [Proteobacteria bacterium]|nr:sensor histidine kinase [Pseudomonadota bacterium]